MSNKKTVKTSSASPYGFPKINVSAVNKNNNSKKSDQKSNKKSKPAKPKITGNSFLDIATGARPSDYYSVKPKATTPAKKEEPAKKPKTVVKKEEPKKVVAKKPESKKAINKDLLDKMTRNGQPNHLDTKKKKIVKNLTPAELAAKIAKYDKGDKKKNVPKAKPKSPMGVAGTKMAAAAQELKKKQDSKVNVKIPSIKDDNKKVEDKKVVTKKSPIAELGAKMAKAGQYLKKKDGAKVKAKIESLKRPDIKKATVKPEVTVTPPKSEPTVSQLWLQKTGTSWSEAKKNGLTDGSASANLALMKKLKSGEINKETAKIPQPGSERGMELFRKERDQNIKDELEGRIKFDEPVPDQTIAKARIGGSVKAKMGSAKKKK